MTIKNFSWTGKYIDDYIVADLIADGPFSWIYSACKDGGTERTAIKISKPAALVGRPDQGVKFPTSAMSFVEGGVQEVHPDAAQLLSLQYEKLASCNDPGMIRVRNHKFIDPDTCFYHMDLLEGLTLRQLIESSEIPVKCLVSIAEILSRLVSTGQLKYHGDLKPENIMVTEGGVVILDPGSFEPLDSQEGSLGLCIVTTPSYYPLLIHDDLLAMGIICWEAALKQHPLQGPTEYRRPDLSATGTQLQKEVEQMELVGQFYYSPILHVQRPAAIDPNISPKLESFLLKALRLTLLDEGRIELGPGFAGFPEMHKALETLCEDG